MNFAEKAVIMNASEMNRALKRMAHEIIEANKGVDNLVLLGVQRRGVTMAKMLAQAIKQVEGHEVPQGALDITQVLQARRQYYSSESARLTAQLALVNTRVDLFAALGGGFDASSVLENGDHHEGS